VTAVLCDIDGVLQVSGQPIPGAADAIQELRDAGHRLRFVTNNSTRPRVRLADDLRGIGIDLAADEIETTPLAAAKHLAGQRVLALTMSAIRPDLARSVDLVDERADVVLLGGADESDETRDVFSWPNLNRAFAELRRGARFVCLHRNRWWRVSQNRALLDGGAFVAALEYAAEVEAEVVGKPSRAFYQAALDELGSRAEDAVMVGDDVASDIGGAKAVGMRGILVRTGKFEEQTLAEADPQPDAVIDSIADLPAAVS